MSEPAQTTPLETLMQAATPGRLLVKHHEKESCLYSAGYGPVCQTQGDSVPLTEKQSNAALLCHWFNHGLGLVKALDAVLDFCDEENISDYRLKEARALLAAVKNVEVSND